MRVLMLLLALQNPAGPRSRSAGTAGQSGNVREGRAGAAPLRRPTALRRPEPGLLRLPPGGAGLLRRQTGGRRRSRPAGHPQRARHSHRTYGRAFFWDGRAATLEEQVLLPIQHPKEMDADLPTVVGRLRADATYRRQSTTSSGARLTSVRSPGRWRLMSARFLPARLTTIGTRPVN